MGKKETIIILGAHSDDFVLGAGGTVAQYAREGKKVISIVFSYGEKSHPWLKEEIIKKRRAEETFKASMILHCQTIFFDLEEFKLHQRYHHQKIEEKLLQLLRTEKPTKIFTHSAEDPHPDHRDVHKITLELYGKSAPKPEVYMYSVWNPVSFQTRYPAFYVDITATFSTKLKALRMFHSQKIHIIYPFLLLLYKAVKDGFKIRKRFGEHFFRIR